jgi:hypothetical protein
MEVGMELTVSLVPLGNTTEREIAILTQEVRDALRRVPGIEALEPVYKEAPDGTKGGFFEEVGSFLLTATPTALKLLLPLLKSILMRPGQPMTEVVVKERNSEVHFKFNPKDVSIQDLVDNVLRLRVHPTGT